jgi:phosphoglycerate dehydrogenase-like enzyme
MNMISPWTAYAKAARSALALLAGGLMALGTSGLARADDAESIASVMARLRVQEAPEPVRERARWRPPRKVVLLAFGRGSEYEARQQAFAAAAPKAQIVVVKDLAGALAASADADVLVGNNPQICDPKIIDHDQPLRWIAAMGAGVENCMAVPGVRGRNLLMTNMRGVDSATIAEHAIALTLALAHGLDVFAVDTAKGVWSAEHGATTPLQTLEGKTLLVVGLGGIGTEVAQRAHALGMKVVATRDTDRNKPDFVSYVGLAGEMLKLAKTADVVVNCVPLTPQTQGMFNAPFFATLKPTAFFVNVARGGSAVTADLAHALNEHRIAGAGLDVTDPEPLPPDNPLWHAPHVIITPHISSRSDLPGEARWILAAENLRRYVNGERMLLVVDLAKGY